jgi:RNA polymerase sigma factor (sigma-70 family)
MAKVTDKLEADSLADMAELPDEIVQRLEQEYIIAAAIRQLDPRCRRLLQQLYFEPDRKSYREIAKTLKIKPDSLGPLRSRCLEKLKKELKKMGYLKD